MILDQLQVRADPLLFELKIILKSTLQDPRRLRTDTKYQLERLRPRIPEVLVDSAAVERENVR